MQPRILTFFLPVVKALNDPTNGNVDGRGVEDALQQRKWSQEFVKRGKSVENKKIGALRVQVL